MKNIFLLIPLLLFSCQNKTEPSAREPASNGLPKGFTAFYQAFHSDSLYQMQHIVFPLQGLPDNADSLTLATDNFHWQEDDWIFQRSMDFEMSEFKREFEPVNDMMVIERIVHENGNPGIVRRFAKVAGEWHLIYYAGLNQFSRK